MTIDRLAALYVKLVPPPRRPATVERRLFWTSAVTALCCATLLVNAFAPWGPTAGLALVVGASLVIARACRGFHLDDRVFRLLGLRGRIELFVLERLSLACGLIVTSARRRVLRAERRRLVRETFYDRVGVLNDRFLLLAAGRWGWFRSALESIALLSMTAFVFALAGRWPQVQGVLGLLLWLPLVFAVLHWPDCVEILDRQVQHVANGDARPAIQRILTAAYDAANAGE